MTRQVPMDEPLSDEDRAYLHARGEHARVVQIDQQYPPLDDVDDATVVREQLNPSGSEDDYEDWTNAELQAELGKRDLSKAGNKAEMIERLRNDDRETAEA